ncbi:MAG: hypothetical protein E6H46_15025, partial [Betaproteobacteria bacterium]
MSVVTPVHAQQSATGSVDTPKSQTQPDATAAQAAKDKAKDATKPSATKDAEASADAKTAQGDPALLPRETITVTGFRFSLERSLETKRNADSVVDVVTADDIGKLPDRNIADAVQRVPGVTISSAAGGEGGFDENDRVSLRGTNPSLTQTLVNGHPIASGDWFVLDQVQTVGRSVSFTLLPSELVSQVIVRKSATADLV